MLLCLYINLNHGLKPLSYKSQALLQEIEKGNRRGCLSFSMKTTLAEKIFEFELKDIDVSRLHHPLQVIVLKASVNRVVRIAKERGHHLFYLLCLWYLRRHVSALYDALLFGAIL